MTNAEVKSDKCLKILIEIEKGQGWSRNVKIGKDYNIFPQINTSKK